MKKKMFWEELKHCSIGDNTFSLFPTMFSKGFLSKVIKPCDCVEKG